jgi:tape measure domain-containing protein
MATDQERLVLQMSADLRAFEKEMARSRQITERRMREVEQRAMQADKNLSRIMGQAGRGMTDALKSSLSGLAPALAAAFSAKAVTEYADAWTNGRNALAAAGVATSDLADRQNELVDLATETRTATETVISLYRRLTIANEELKLSQTDVLRLTELVTKSFVTSGASTQEAASAALQLSQALASGVLQGDELRSIRENAPQLAQAIAKAMGVGIGELKKLGAEGKITAQVVSSAILGAGDQIEAKFATTTATVGQALQILDNEFGRYIGQTDASVSATARAAQAIVLLSQNLDTLIPIIGTLATFFGVRYAGGLAVASAQMIAAGINTARLTAFNIAMTASLTGATRAQVALNMAMSANPVGAVITVVAALAAGLFLLATRYNTTAIAARELDRVVGAADGALEEYRQAVEKAKNASAEEREELEKKAAALRQVTLARINDAKVAAQKQIDEAVAARARADRAIGASSDARQRSFANPNNASAALAGGASSNARAAISLAVRAREEADTAIQAYERLKSAMDEVENPTVSSGGGGSTPDDGKGSKSSGPTPEELARQRAMLAAQGQIELLRAQGRTADADAAQRRLDALNLEKQYADAGFTNAKALAELQVNAVAQAEAAARGREEGQRRATELLDMAVEAQRRQNDELIDQVSLEAELARLSGDPKRIEQAERDLYIEQRINDLLRDRTGLITAADRAVARRTATDEWNALDTADTQGRIRQEVHDAFRDGFRDLVAGDLGGLFEGLADRFTSKILDNLADDLADIVMNAFKAEGGGGGGLLSGVLGLFGKRATGGSVVAGQPYIVGERRPEVFVPSTNGTVIPSVNAAMAQANRVRGDGGGAFAVHVVPSPLFQVEVERISAPLAVQAGVATYQQLQTERSAAQRTARYRQGA